MLEALQYGLSQAEEQGHTAAVCIVLIVGSSKLGLESLFSATLVNLKIQ